MKNNLNVPAFTDSKFISSLIFYLMDWQNHWTCMATDAGIPGVDPHEEWTGMGSILQLLIWNYHSIWEPRTQCIIHTMLDLHHALPLNSSSSHAMNCSASYIMTHSLHVLRLCYHSVLCCWCQMSLLVFSVVYFIICTILFCLFVCILLW